MTSCCWPAAPTRSTRPCPNSPPSPGISPWCVTKPSPWARFDIYRGKNIGEGKKSVAFNLTLRADDRSLTGEEADEDVKSILEALEKDCGAVLR